MASQTSPSQSSSVTVFGIIGWLGTLLVFASVGIRFLRPEWAQYQQYAAWAGLAMVLVYVASEWREVLTLLQSRSGRYGSMSAIGPCIEPLVRIRRSSSTPRIRNSSMPRRQDWKSKPSLPRVTTPNAKSLHCSANPCNGAGAVVATTTS